MDLINEDRKPVEDLFWGADSLKEAAFEAYCHPDEPERFKVIEERMKAVEARFERLKESREEDGE